MRMIAVFNKGKTVRFISHLDLQRAIQRAMRRADLPVAYSQGFNPHSLLSFASAPAVGMLSEYEVMDVKLSDNNVNAITPAWIISKLNATLPEDLMLKDATLVPDNAPSPMALLQRADYDILCGWPIADINRAITGFLESDSVVITKKTKNGDKQVDIRPMVHKLFAQTEVHNEDALRVNDGIVIKACVSLCEKAAVRPEMLIRGLAKYTSDERRHDLEDNEFLVTRTALLTQNSDDIYVPLIDVYRESWLLC